ncbi:hypothetical protein [Methanobacterium spitsbergense]|uniref:Uncharacterized protein n=1 Tax=Methanobacterium spitsbergense TaxID=2874285 RepID=A0A8T5UYJ9_9EURY|nr:hypothetical protein [Methanobacterium spitsbergense]MBZ2167006.1 hypothetical protein [Methanobacterium spitsbergense]
MTGDKPISIPQELRKLSNAILTKAFATANTNGTPTNAQLISAFGGVATVGAGFQGVFLDSHASGKTYRVICDGVKYFVNEATAAA